MIKRRIACKKATATCRLLAAAEKARYSEVDLNMLALCDRQVSDLSIVAASTYIFYPRVFLAIFNVL